MEGGMVDMESQALVWNHILGAVNSIILKLAIKLKISDILTRHGRPVPLPVLSASLPVPCTNLSNLRRILRYLANMRLITVHQGADGHDDDDDDDSVVAYGLSPASKLIATKDESKSLAAFATYFIGDHYLSPIQALHTCLAGDPDVPAYERLKGESIWARVLRVPRHNELFNEAMAASARLAVPGLMAACKGTFEGIASLVDVGGGTGTAARAIVGEFPHVRCTVFDRPHVVKALPGYPGISYVGGDMFSSVPSADAVLLMWILHDWNDEQCGRILRRCREAIHGEDGKLIVVEAVISEGEKNRDGLSDARLALDMIMMAYSGGKERTEREWRALLSAAGFSRCKITPIMALQLVIEAQP